MFRIFVLFAGVAIAQAGRLLDVDYVEEIIAKGNDGRFSDNVIEDAYLDVPELVRKYKYPLEEHTVVTPDGYILGVHRIPHGRDNNNVPGTRPIIFLMHGLIGSSADFVLMGPGSSLAYVLAEEGFDIWMGNGRGNYYSRKHLFLRPDALLNTDFWNFSWDEIGNIDLPAMIDYALNSTGRTRLHYVGFSQGTTSFFVMASLRPEYNAKIISMHALAPVAYMANNRNLLLNALAPFSNSITELAKVIGIGEFFPNRLINTLIGQALCRDEAPLQRVCSSILFLMGGRNENQHNATMLPVIVGHTPAGASVRQLAHYGQGIAGKDFRRYNFGWLENIRRYRNLNPPKYDLWKISAPVFLHFSDSDPLAHTTDVARLFSELGNPLGKFRVPQSTFSHLDFIWGIDARTLVWNQVISLIKTMEIHGLDDVPES